MRKQSVKLILGPFIVLVLMLAQPAVPGEKARPQLPAAGQADVSNSDLEAFAKAYVAYHKIRQTYEPQISKARNPKEKEKIRKEGNSKVKQALEKHGLTAQTYNRLFTAVNDNPALRQKALKLIDQERIKS